MSPWVRPRARQRQHHLANADTPPLTLLTVCGSKPLSRSRGTAIPPGPTSVSNVLAREPLRLLPLPAPAGSFLSYWR